MARHKFRVYPKDNGQVIELVSPTGIPLLRSVKPARGQQTAINMVEKLKKAIASAPVVFLYEEPMEVEKSTPVSRKTGKPKKEEKKAKLKAKAKAKPKAKTKPKKLARKIKK